MRWFWVLVIAMPQTVSDHSFQPPDEQKVLRDIVNALPKYQSDKEFYDGYFGQFSPDPLGKGEDISSREVRSIKGAVSKILSDPVSARYQFPQISDRNVYCLSVNSKNKFGGYSGFKVALVRYSKEKSSNIIEVMNVFIADEQAYGASAANEITRRCRLAGYGAEIKSGQRQAP